MVALTPVRYLAARILEPLTSHASMRPVIRPLLVLHEDADFRARVRQAAGEMYEYGEVGEWDELEEALRTAPPTAMVLVNPAARQRGERLSGGLSPRLRSLLESYPSTAVIAAMEGGRGAYQLLRKLNRWGVLQVILIGHDDTITAIARRLDDTRGRPMRALLDEVLPAATSGRARVIIAAAADVVATGGHGRDLASALGLSRRTLLRWSQRAALPPPRQLLAWMRVLLACALLDDPGRSVYGIAVAAGYASDSGLRRVTQNLLEASPTELRETGAFRRASSAFVKVLDAHRLHLRPASREE